MLTDVKLREAQISKIVQSVGFFDSQLNKLGEKVVKNLVISIGRDLLPGLGGNIARI